MKKDHRVIPPGYSRHHRNPVRFGGSDSEENISIVLTIKHQAWNVLFDRYQTSMVAELLQKYWKKFGNEKAILIARRIVLKLLSSLKHRNKGSLFPAAKLREIRESLNISRAEAKKLFAWILLFDGLPLEEVVADINQTWIDPASRLEIKRTAKTIKIVMIDGK